MKGETEADRGGGAQMCTSPPPSPPYVLHNAGKLIPPLSAQVTGHNERGRSQTGTRDRLRAASRQGTDGHQIWAECLHPFLICCVRF